MRANATQGSSEASALLGKRLPGPWGHQQALLSLPNLSRAPPTLPTAQDTISTPQLPCSWLGWWDRSWLPCSALTNPMGPPHCSGSWGSACPLTEMRKVRVQVPFPKPDWGILSCYSLHGQEKRSETKICTLDCEPQSLPHTTALPLPAFSVFLLSVLRCIVVQQQYLRSKDDPFPKTYSTVFCISLFSPFLAVCRRDARCSGPSLSPHTAQCTECRVPLWRQLALSSKNTFSNMTVICQPMSWSKHDLIFNISFVGCSPKIIVSQ